MKWKVAGIIFIFGFIGILSMLTMEIPLPAEAKDILEAQFTPTQIKLLLLINPTILLVVATVIGTLVIDKVNLSIPFIESWFSSNNSTNYNFIKFGVLGGILSGILITIVSTIYTPILPQEFLELGENLKPSLANRFLYGGFTEEVLLRYGVMTFFVWALSKVSKSLSNPMYWIGIILSSILFALGHFPVAFQVVNNPSTTLLSYILIGNSIGGVIFGWLYWKKGLESAFIAHITTHVVMVTAESIL